MKPALLKNIRRQWNYNTFRQSLAVLNVSILNNFALDNYQNQSTCDTKSLFLYLFSLSYVRANFNTTNIPKQIRIGFFGTLNAFVLS